jgi:hypothetical protein
MRAPYCSKVITDENFASAIPNPPKITSGKVVAYREGPARAGPSALLPLPKRWKRRPKQSQARATLPKIGDASVIPRWQPPIPGASPEVAVDAEGAHVRTVQSAKTTCTLCP